MNTPMPVDPTPVPSPVTATAATGLSAILGWGAMVLAQKWSIPIDVVGGGLGLLFTGLTALWHRAIPAAPPTQAAVQKAEAGK